MKFIIDAQLPKSLCEYFKDCDCIHTSQLDKGNQTRDSYLNELSVKERRALITKDADFYFSYITIKKPYKLVLVRLGNMRLTEIRQYFENNSNDILRLLEHHSFIILEKRKIRILE